MSKPAQEHYWKHRITWKFIVERAAWWGGFWDRMVRTVKTCLRKVLGKDRYNFEKLTTILHEVEAIVNSRPLTFLHASSGEQEVLTPAHFLTGKRLTSLPTLCEPDTKIDTSNDLTRLWKHHQRQLDHFWTRWRRKYLLQWTFSTYRRHQAVAARTNNRGSDLPALPIDNGSYATSSFALRAAAPA
ncbi:uncharacterized protein ISCGN_031405 [Ixodes scapularis]